MSELLPERYLMRVGERGSRERFAIPGWNDRSLRPGRVPQAFSALHECIRCTRCLAELGDCPSIPSRDVPFSDCKGRVPWPGRKRESGEAVHLLWFLRSAFMAVMITWPLTPWSISRIPNEATIWSRNWGLWLDLAFGVRLLFPTCDPQ